MKPTSVLLALSLSLLAACGGAASESADPAQLLQQGKIDEAVEIIEARLADVERGTAAEKDLVLDYSEGLSHSDAARARKVFMDFAEANEALVEPRDYKMVVSHLRTQKAFLDAIEVMHAGKTRWPEDTDMVTLVEMLKADVEKANDPAAKSKMEGLGYM